VPLIEKNNGRMHNTQHRLCLQQNRSFSHRLGKDELGVDLTRFLFVYTPSTAPHLVSAFIGKLHFHGEIMLVYSFCNWFYLIAYFYVSLFQETNF